MNIYLNEYNELVFVRRGDNVVLTVPYEEASKIAALLEGDIEKAEVCEGLAEFYFIGENLVADIFFQGLKVEWETDDIEELEDLLRGQFQNHTGSGFDLRIEVAGDGGLAFIWHREFYPSLVVHTAVLKEEQVKALLNYYLNAFFEGGSGSNAFIIGEHEVITLKKNVTDVGDDCSDGCFTSVLLPDKYPRRFYLPDEVLIDTCIKTLSESKNSLILWGDSEEMRDIFNPDMLKSLTPVLTKWVVNKLIIPYIELVLKRHDIFASLYYIGGVFYHINKETGSVGWFKVLDLKGRLE